MTTTEATFSAGRNTWRCHADGISRQTQAQYYLSSEISELYACFGLPLESKRVGLLEDRQLNLSLAPHSVIPMHFLTARQALTTSV